MRSTWPFCYCVCGYLAPESSSIAASSCMRYSLPWPANQLQHQGPRPPFLTVSISSTAPAHQVQRSIASLLTFTLSPKNPSQTPSPTHLPRQCTHPSKCVRTWQFRYLYASTFVSKDSHTTHVGAGLAAEWQIAFLVVPRLVCLSPPSGIALTR